MQQFLKIHEVAELLRCSVPTIRRRLAEARRGECHFPLPITKPCGRAMWRADDILSYTENRQPVLSKQETKKQSTVRRRSEIAGLARHGIRIEN